VNCLICQGRSKVTSSQSSSEGVRRVRECILCGGRWSTHEMFHMKLKVVRKPKPKPRLQAKPPRGKNGPRKNQPKRKKKSSARVYTRSLLDRDDLDFDDDF